MSNVRNVSCGLGVLNVEGRTAPTPALDLVLAKAGAARDHTVTRCASPPLVPYRFNPAVHSRDPSRALVKLRGELRAELRTLAALDSQTMPLTYTRCHMALHAAVLGRFPDAKFLEVQCILAEIGAPPHPLLAGEAQNHALVAELKCFSERPEAVVGGLAEIWSRHCQRVALVLGAYDSLCREVLHIMPGDRTQIEPSHRLFREYARTVTTEMVDSLPRLVDGFFARRIELSQRWAVHPTASSQEQAAAQQAVTQLRTARERFSLFRERDLTSSGNTHLAIKTAEHPLLTLTLKNIFREEVIAQLKADAGKGLVMARVFADFGFPQGVSSWLHFGYIASLVARATADSHPLIAITAVGFSLGAFHKFVSDGARPFAQLLVDKTIGYGLAKVDPLDVYPQPLKVITLNGVPSSRSPAALSRLDHQREEARQAFERAQHAHALGVSSGDFVAFSTFGGALAIRDVLVQLKAMNANDIHWRAWFSQAGGTLMGGALGLAKYHQHAGADDVPTHRITRQSKPWKELAQTAGQSALSRLSPLNRENLTDVAARMLGASQGLAIQHGLSLALPGTDPSGAASHASSLHVAITYFLSGVMLHSFFANLQAPAEAKALGHEDPAELWRVAYRNICQPNRSDGSHTHPPGSSGRSLENAYQVSRGLVQVGPLAIISAANALVNVVAGRHQPRPRAASDSDLESQHQPEEDTAIELVELPPRAPGDPS